MADASPDKQVAPVPTKPNFKFPPLSCDCHCHIFGPADKFPFMHTSGGGGDLFEASKESLMIAHDILGIERAVIVHANSHGTDNSVTLDAIAAGGGNRRGIALVDDDITDAELSSLHDGGIRGVRYGFPVRHGGPPSRERLMRMSSRMAELDWHLVFLFGDGDLVLHEETMRQLPSKIVFDHMGWLQAKEGVSQPGFQLLLELLKDGRYWVKVSGSTRVSEAPYTGAIPLASALIESAPDRVIWGTDWPHPNPGPAGVPDDGKLADIMAQFTTDDGSRQKFLVDNPAILYQFD